MARAMAIEDSTNLGAKLEYLVTSRFLSARWASRVWMVRDLPKALQRCVQRLAPDTAWRAYADDTQVLFAIAHSRDDGAQADSCSSMDVYFLDGDAAVFSAGTWVFDHAQGWWLDAVLPASYDSEHGWWLESVMASRADVGEEYQAPLDSNPAHSRCLTFSVGPEASPPPATPRCGHRLARRTFARRRRSLVS
jgi:hypothetical protein